MFVYVCVCVCVCPCPRLLITSGVMWRDMDLIRLVKQVLQLLPYIGNQSQKKTFVNFVDFGMIGNVFLLPFSVL